MPVAAANESGQTRRREGTSTRVGGRLGKYMRANVDTEGWRATGRVGEVADDRLDSSEDNILMTSNPEIACYISTAAKIIL
jgi:hypothetical protein